MAKYNIHAGHCPAGKRACGAVGILNESMENRRVKDRVISAMKSAGHTVYDCTDDTDCSVNQNLANIVAKCNQHDVTLDVSIHLNAGGGNGVEVWCYSEKTKAVAERICKGVSKTLGIPNRGVKFSKTFYVLRKTKAPAILVECCFVDSKSDAAKWSTSRCGDAIASAILNEKVSGAPKRRYTGTYPTLPPRGYYKIGDGYKTLEEYSTQIKRVQKALNWVLKTKLVVDGDYGEKTAAACRQLQKQYGLVVDGLFGEKTLQKVKNIKKVV